MSITTATTYQCDGCGFETTEPDAARSRHATLTVGISHVVSRWQHGVTIGDVTQSISKMVDHREIENINAWVCGECMNKVLAIINQRFEVVP